MVENEEQFVSDFILESDSERLRDRPVDRDRRVGDHCLPGSVTTSIMTRHQPPPDRLPEA